MSHSLSAPRARAQGQGQLDRLKAGEEKNIANQAAYLCLQQVRRFLEISYSNTFSWTSQVVDMDKPIDGHVIRGLRIGLGCIRRSLQARLRLGRDSDIHKGCANKNGEKIDFEAIVFQASDRRRRVQGGLAHPSLQSRMRPVFRLK